MDPQYLINSKDSDLKSAILPLPPLVSPTTLVSEVLYLMNKERTTCSLTGSNNVLDNTVLRDEQSSCVFIIKNERLVGIFTERDIVRHIACNTLKENIPIQDVMTSNPIGLKEDLFTDIFAVLHLFRQLNSHHIPILNKSGYPIGLVTPTSVRQILKPVDLLKRRSVSEVMTNHVIQASTHTSILELAQLMSSHLVSCIVISEPHNHTKFIPVGIVTERDIVQFKSMSLDLENTQAHTVMSSPLFALTPNHYLWDAHQIMQQRRVQRLVVTGAEGELLGIITQSSILLALDPLVMYESVNLLQEKIEQLEIEKQQRHRVEKALESSEAQYRLLFEANPSPMWIYNGKTLAFIAVNQAAIDHYGYSQAEFANMTIADIRVDQAISTLRNYVFDNSSNSYSAEWKHRKKNGMIIDVEITSHAIIWEGQPAQFILAKDITDRKAVELAIKQLNQDLENRVAQRTSDLQESEHRLRNFFDNANDLIQSVSPEGRFLFVNRAWQEILGYSETDLKNLSVFDIIHPHNREHCRATLQLVISGMPCVNLEVIFITKDGREIIVEGNVNGFFKNGNLIATQGIFRDVTQRKHAEQENQLLRDRLKFVLNSTPVILFTSKPYDNYESTFISDNVKEVLGYDAQEFLSNPSFWLDHIHPDDLEIILTNLPNLFKCGYHVHEYRFLHKNGSYRWIRNELKLISNSQGSPLEIVGYGIDISDIFELDALRQQTEANLQEKMAAVEAASDGIAILKEDFYTYINAAYLNIWGYDSTEELLGKNWLELYQPEEIGYFNQNVFPILKKEKHWRGEVIANRKNGELFYQELSLSITETGDWICVCQDISDRKRSEAELEKLVKELSDFKFAIDQSSVLSISDNQGVITYANDKFCEISKYSRDELLGKNYHIINSGYHSQEFFHNLWLTIKNGQVWRNEVKNKAKDGSFYWVDLTVVPLVDREGISQRFLSFCTDITNRKLAEEALQESELKFRQLAENIHQVLWILNPQDQRILYISPAYDEIWQRSRDQLYQDPDYFVDSIHIEDRNYVKSLLKNIIKGFDIEYRILRADGEIRWIQNRAFPLKNDQGEVYRITGIAEDITDRKQAETDIQNALEKERELSDLKSRFISMTSHEFRTPLAVISSSAGILKDFGAKLNEEKKKQHLDRIQTYVKHTTTLLDDILLLNQVEVGKLAFNPNSLNLIQFCQVLVEELQLSTSDHQINFLIKVDDDAQLNLLNNANMDEKLLRQILINLLSNAIKYSPDGKDVIFELNFDNNSVIFTVIDQGIGIPKEEQEFLFESFHRAKNVGNIPGTGLGLSIVKKCVNLHGGNVSLSSIIDVGTTFTVVIPFQLAT